MVKIKHILPEGSALYFELVDGKKPETYRFEITLRENLRIYSEPSKDLTLLKVKVNYNLYKDGSLLINQNDFISLRKFYEKPYSTSDYKNSNDYLKGIILSSTNQTLETIVKL